VLLPEDACPCLLDDEVERVITHRWVVGAGWMHLLPSAPQAPCFLQQDPPALPMFPPSPRACTSLRREKEGCVANPVDPWASREFFVKWARYSYLHCSWDQKATLSQVRVAGWAWVHG
jgi:hypothetical protein